VNNDGNGPTIGNYLGGGALLGGDLIVGHAGNECETGGSAELIDGGYDISDDSTCPFSVTGSTEGWSLAGTLSALGWYGGPAETVVPSSASLLTTIPESTTASGMIFGHSVSATLCADPTFNDERDLLRPYGSNALCTIGATESVPLVPGLWNTDTASFQIGVAGSVPINETDVPSSFTPGYTTLGSLPQGLALTDDGNGTATISGTAAPGTAGTVTAMVVGTSQDGLNDIDPVTITITPAVTTTTTTTTSNPPTPAPVTLSISGPSAGEVYFGAAPAAKCAAKACTITKHATKTAGGTLVTVTAAAPGATTVTLKYTLATATLPFHPPAGELYATGSSRNYTLVIVSKTRPKLVTAVLSPERPKVTAGLFKADGRVGRTPRWSARVKLGLVKHKPAKWHVGILVGKQLDMLALVS
jgi:hypothetical protein